MSKSFFASAIFLVLIAAFASNARGGVVPLNSTAPDGRGYPQLTTDWWKWAVKEPSTSNPLNDPDGTFANLNQSGEVYFLAPSLGNDYTRLVTIPAGKYLFFPVLNSLALNAPGETFTEPELRQQLADFFGATTELNATLDGQPLTDVFNFQVASPPGGFEIDLPDDDIFGLGAGHYGPPVLSDGFHLLLEPLTPGHHTLKFSGAIGDPANPDFSQSVTYELTQEAVPEPGMLGLIVVGAIGLIRRR